MPILDASVETITGGENVLILAPHPADETLGCGGLIARSCQAGRPPFLMVLADGSTAPQHHNTHTADALANLRERETRAAVQLLGLPVDRLIMVGLFDGHIPAAGPIFDAVVKAVGLVMWARDCNVICAPWQGSPVAEHAASAAIAAEVARRTGVGRISYAHSDWPLLAGVSGWCLDIAAQAGRKQAAMAAHASEPQPAEIGAFEIFLPHGPDRHAE